jgi:hypothetical protein
VKPEISTAAGRKGQKMASADLTGTLLLSIHLELELEDQDQQAERRLDDIRRRLIDVTKSADFPATWAVADPMLSAASESILAANVGHEIAVVGDEAWLGPGCGRARLSRELVRRFSAPCRSGIAVNTLMLRNSPEVGDLDLFIAHGVMAIAAPATSEWSDLRKSPQPPTRYGIWQPPTALRLPLQGKWWSPTNWLIRREIKRAIRKRSTLHLCIDAPRLLSNSEHSLDSIAALLKYAVSKRSTGHLQIATIGQLATQALHARAGNPTRSILRPAA